MRTQDGPWTAPSPCSPILLSLLLLISTAGCATTSDDPREGGLFGYWQHGEEGYQRRLDEKSATLEEQQQRAAQSDKERDALEARKAAAQATLQTQREALDAMSGELEGLKAVCEGIRTETELQEQARGELRTELLAVESELEELRSTPPPGGDIDDILRERKRRVSELQKELNLLRERASLLTTL